MGTKLEVYERLVDLCMRLDDGEGAQSEIFGYIEQAKSRSLRDLFFERVPLAVAATGPTELVRQIRDCFHLLLLTCGSAFLTVRVLTPSSDY